MPYHRAIVNMIPFWGVVLVLAAYFAVVATAAYYTVKKYFPWMFEERMSPSSYLMASAVAFLKGFTIILLWQNYQKAMALSLDEATSFFVFFQHLENMSAEFQHAIIPALQNYMDVLKNQEWPALRLGISVSTGWEAFSNLYNLTHKFLAQSGDPVNYGTLVRLLDNITLTRMSRLQSADPLLVIGLFPVILVGASFIVFSLSITGPINLYNRLFLVISIGLLSVNLGLASMLRYPFSGDYGIKGVALLENIPQKLDKLARKNSIEYYQAVLKKKLGEPESDKKTTMKKNYDQRSSDGSNGSNSEQLNMLRLN